MNWKLLAAPIPANEIKSRKQAKVQVRYITARTVMQRLDDVATPAGWRDEYRETDRGVVCTLYIKVGEEWIGKTDIGTESNFEGDKGAYSDALKRAAVRWGIARELYGDTPPQKQQSAKRSPQQQTSPATPGQAAPLPAPNQHPDPPQVFENLGMFKSWASQRGYTTTEDMIAAVGMSDLNVAIAANSVKWFESKMPPK